MALLPSWTPSITRRPQNDVAVFNAQWPLAATSFTKIFANGNGSCVTPPFNAGWALEESLDIEWAHVFAPKAAIILVEACSNSFADLFFAEQVAFNSGKSHASPEPCASAKMDDTNTTAAAAFPDGSRQLHYILLRLDMTPGTAHNAYKSVTTVRATARECCSTVL